MDGAIDPRRYSAGKSGREVIHRPCVIRQRFVSQRGMRYPLPGLTWIIGDQARRVHVHRRVMPHSRRFWLGLLVFLMAAGGYAWWHGPNAIPSALLGHTWRPRGDRRIRQYRSA